MPLDGAEHEGVVDTVEGEATFTPERLHPTEDSVEDASTSSLQQTKPSEDRGARSRSASSASAADSQRKPVGGRAETKRRLPPGVTALNIPRSASHARKSSLSTLSGQSPKFASFGGGSSISMSLKSQSPMSAVTPTSAFSSGTFHAHRQTSHAQQKGTVGEVGQTSSASANMAKEVDSPSIDEMNAFGLSPTPTVNRATVEDPAVLESEAGQAEDRSRPRHQRKGSQLSLSSQRSRSLSIGVVPPPTSVLWSHATPTHTHEEIYGKVTTSSAQHGNKLEGTDSMLLDGPETGRLGELKRFTLWETKTRFYLVAFNTSQTRFRILKIDRTPPIAVQAPVTPGHMDGDVGKRQQDGALQTDGSHGLPMDKKAFIKGTGAVTAASTDSTMFSLSGERYVNANTADNAVPRPGADTRQLGLARDSKLTGPTGNPSVISTAGSIASTNVKPPPTPKTSTLSAFPFPASSTSEKKDVGATHLAGSGGHSNAEQKKTSIDDSADWELNVVADSVVYTRTQVEDLLDMLREGNKASGGLKEIGRFYGIVGFIRFTSTYYMVLISKRSVVALLGGHYVYHCDETKIIPICDSSTLASIGGKVKAKEQEEARLLATFKQVDLGKNFYFSYTYDLTKTLQENLTGNIDSATSEAQTSDQRHEPMTAWGFNEKFIWNHHMLMPAFGSSVHRTSRDIADGSEWVLPLVYGFVDQAKLNVLSRTIYVTLIARRSRHFAGARFLKRGVTEKGQVANDVETEQIVSEPLTSPFFAPKKPRGEAYADHGQEHIFDASPRFTSYVMHRGSIPIYWTQDSTNMSPRPPIEISVVDPYYSAAALHFDDMFRRYGAPVIILNLIKSKEKNEREVKLGRAFGECVNYLNQFLPQEKKLRYTAWDMSFASKTRGLEVITVLDDLAQQTLDATKFFHSGPEPTSFDREFSVDGSSERRQTIQLQCGIARVNCVDCLDRTNAAQFMIGKKAFGYQLYALGLLDDPALPFDCDAVNMLTEMYHDLGDTIALQYGGSHLVNTMETYRKINQWTSHSRDMLEGLKRYYSNSFVDAEKQAAINLFLGVDADAPETARALNANWPRYQKWFEPRHLEPQVSLQERTRQLLQIVNADKGFWAEYYRPRLFTDMLRHHAFKMTAMHQQLPLYVADAQEPKRVESPESTRTSHQVVITSPFVNKYTASRHRRKASRGGSTPAGYESDAASTISATSQSTAIIGGVRRWMSINKSNMSAASRRKRAARGRHAGGSSGLQDVSEDAGAMTDLPPDGTKKVGQQNQPAQQQPVAGATAGNPFPPLETVLSRVQAPTVSTEEAFEYEWYATQFSADTLTLSSSSFVRGHSADDPISQSHAHHHGIDEADLVVYEDSAALAAGSRPPALVTMDRIDVETLDPVLLAYANAVPGSQALAARLEKVSEAKVRAYSQWLQSHTRK